MNRVIERSFSINLSVLHLLGLYPSEKHSSLYSTYGFLLMCLCLIPDPLLGLLYFVKVDDSNIWDAGFNIFLLQSMICFIPKLSPFIINHNKIRKCINFVETSVCVSLNDKQRKIVDECVRICRRNSTLFFTCVIINVITWSSRPLFSKNRELPIDVWLPFNPTRNSVIFYFTYILIDMGAIYSGLVSAAIDPLIGGLAYHAATQIMVLKDNLQNLNKKKFETKTENVYQKIVHCVEHHNAILTFVKEMENCFSLVVFSQFAGSIVIICFCCLQLSKLEAGSLGFVLMTIYLCSVLTQIFFYCYYGTTLYEESKTLTSAVYMGPWYDYDLKSKKALTILMEKSNTSMTITSGKLFDLSLTTFTTILRRSYSLLAVLRNY